MSDAVTCQHYKCCVSYKHSAAVQGVQYDDDEGYEDTLDDGGDEGPTY